MQGYCLLLAALLSLAAPIAVAAPQDPARVDGSRPPIPPPSSHDLPGQQRASSLPRALAPRPDSMLDRILPHADGPANQAARHRAAHARALSPGLRQRRRARAAGAHVCGRRLESVRKLAATTAVAAGRPAATGPHPAAGRAHRAGRDGRDGPAVVAGAARHQARIRRRARSRLKPGTEPASNSASARANSASGGAFATIRRPSCGCANARRSACSSMRWMPRMRNARLWRPSPWLVSPIRWCDRCLRWRRIWRKRPVSRPRPQQRIARGREARRRLVEFARWRVFRNG